MLWRSKIVSLRQLYNFNSVNSGSNGIFDDNRIRSYLKKKQSNVEQQQSNQK